MRGRQRAGAPAGVAARVRRATSAGQRAVRHARELRHGWAHGDAARTADDDADVLRHGCETDQRRDAGVRAAGDAGEQREDGWIAADTRGVEDERAAVHSAGSQVRHGDGGAGVIRPDPPRGVGRAVGEGCVWCERRCGGACLWRFCRVCV